MSVAIYSLNIDDNVGLPVYTATTQRDPVIVLYALANNSRTALHVICIRLVYCVVVRSVTSLLHLHYAFVVRCPFSLRRQKRNHAK